MYIDYATYQNMGGTLDETTFNDYEFQAETLVNWVTFNRLKKEVEYPAELPKLMYVLIHRIELKMAAVENDFLTEDGSVKPGSIRKQTNDGVGIEFNNLSADYVIDFGSDKNLEDLVRKYLSGLKNSLGQSLTYRGLYPGE